MPGYIICAEMENKSLHYSIENGVISSSGLKHSFDFQKIFSQSSVLQIPAFAGSFYAKRKCRFFRLIKNEIVIGVCLVSEYLIHAEIQFGPQVINDSDIGFFIGEICSFYRRKIYMQIKICFPSDLRQNIFESAVDYLSENLTLTKENKGTWSSLIINLNTENKKIQAGYSKNLKRNIKKAIQLGIYVRELNNPKDIKNLGAVFDKLYKWRKVKSQWNDSPATFLLWFESEELKKKIIWFGVYNSNNEMLGGVMFVNQGDTIFYQIGASDPEQRNLPILHLCFHHVILYAKENHFSFFDFGGYDTDTNENDQIHNINNFKRQFGGELVSSFPNIIVTLNKKIKCLYNIYKKMRKI
jgi:hypothetical protein